VVLLLEAANCTFQDLIIFFLYFEGLSALFILFLDSLGILVTIIIGTFEVGSTSGTATGILVHFSN
jgi:hypothetical protein